MALLKCRDCGEEIRSEVRLTRCKGCGTLFPFSCAVCMRKLRPPFPVYPDERYLNGAERPLCPDHFQRQCPDCRTWFQADENSGFFKCKVCMEGETASETRPSSSPESTPVHFPQWDEELVPSPASRGGETSFLPRLPLVVACLSVLVLIGILLWQTASLIKVLFMS